MIGFITVALLLGAAVGLLSLFWKDIVSFLKKGLTKIQEKLQLTVEGSSISIMKVRGAEMITEISRHYSRVEEHWHETTIRREVPPADIPKEYLEKVGQEELDITDQLQLELERIN